MGWRLKLPRPPLVSLDRVEYLPASTNAAVEIDVNQFIVDTNGDPGRIAFKSGYGWPSVELQQIGGLVLEFTGGLGETPADVPDSVKLAIKMRAADFYENRESVLVGQGTTVTELPMGSKHLLGKKRFRNI